MFLKLVKQISFLRVSKMHVLSNLFSCFVFPHRKFHFKYHSKAAAKFNKPCDFTKKKNATKLHSNATQLLRSRNVVKSVKRSSAIKVVQGTRIIRRNYRRRKSRSDYEAMGLYNLESGKFPNESLIAVNGVIQST